MLMPGHTTLYERLGGYVGISAVVDDFVERLFRDPRVGGRLQGNPSEARRNLRLLTVDLLCAASGAPRSPQSRTVLVGRRGFGMSAGEWRLTVEHLLAALAHVGLDTDDRREVLDLVAPLGGDGRREPSAAPAPVRRAIAPLVVRLAAGSSLLHERNLGAGAA